MREKERTISAKNWIMIYSPSPFIFSHPEHCSSIVHTWTFQPECNLIVICNISRTLNWIIFLHRNSSSQITRPQFIAPTLFLYYTHTPKPFAFSSTRTDPIDRLNSASYPKSAKLANRLQLKIRMKSARKEKKSRFFHSTKGLPEERLQLVVKSSSSRKRCLSQCRAFSTDHTQNNRNQEF